jgi:ribosomal protein S27AE
MRDIAMAQKAMICPVCGIEMNHHADKLVYSDESHNAQLGGAVEEFHSCPNCGRTESRAAE